MTHLGNTFHEKNTIRVPEKLRNSKIQGIETESEITGKLKVKLQGKVNESGIKAQTHQLTSTECSKRFTS